MTAIEREFIEYYYPELAGLSADETSSRLHEIGQTKLKEFQDLLMSPSSQSISLLCDDDYFNTPIENYLRFTANDDLTQENHAIDSMLSLFGYKQKIVFLSEDDNDIAVNENSTMLDIFSRQNEHPKLDSLVKHMELVEQDNLSGLTNSMEIMKQENFDSTSAIFRYRDVFLSIDNIGGVLIQVSPMEQFYQAYAISPTGFLNRYVGKENLHNVYESDIFDEDMYFAFKKSVKSARNKAIQKAIDSSDSQRDFFFFADEYGHVTVYIKDAETMSRYSVDEFYKIVSDNFTPTEISCFNDGKYYANKINSINGQVMEDVEADLRKLIDHVKDVKKTLTPET